MPGLPRGSRNTPARVMNIGLLMGKAPVVPVLVIEDPSTAVPIAEALVEGGLTVIEVTLRTNAAFDAIAEMSLVKGAIVGAGTVLNEVQLHKALNAGARFAVSPGLTGPLVEEALTCSVPLLAGVATASDVMRGLDFGLEHFKFFPAEAAGGIATLKALSAPFARCRFCPTGGITRQTAPDWLALSNVPCVGGTWIVPKGESDLRAISRRARCASAMRNEGASCT